MSMNIKTTQYDQNIYDMVKKDYEKNSKKPVAKEDALGDVRNQAGKVNNTSKTNEAKLSAKAQKFLKDLRKQHGEWDFFVGNSTDDLKALAKSGSKEFTVIFSNAEIERMATDETYAAERMKMVDGAVRMSEAIKEKYGQKSAFGKLNHDVAISKIAISFNEDGSTTLFAELEKMSQQQRERIEATREKRAEEKKVAEKKAAEKENDFVKRTVVSASSMDELIARINEVDWSKVKEEGNVGSRFDFFA